MEFASLIQDFAELMLHPADERSKSSHEETVGGLDGSSFLLTYPFCFIKIEDVESRSDANTYSVIHNNNECRVAAPSPTKPPVLRASPSCSPRKRRHRRNRIVLAATITKGTMSFSSWEKQIRRHRNHALTDFDHILCAKAVGHVIN